MAKQFKNKTDYLRSQTSARLLKFANNSKSPNYRASVQILNERLQKSIDQAVKANKKTFENYGFMERVATGDGNLSGKELSLRFTAIIDINKSIVKNYQQLEKGTKIVLKGGDGHPPIIEEHYNNALRKAMSEGRTEEEAREYLKSIGWTEQAKKEMARRIVRANRESPGDSDLVKIIYDTLKKYQKKLYGNDHKNIKLKDTSEFRGTAADKPNFRTTKLNEKSPSEYRKMTTK